MSAWISPEFDEHEQVCFFCDRDSGLRAIVAIHSTILGPAAGGTRFKPYDTIAAAVDDALRLSRAMSYKSALAGVPAGGGKSVILGDPAKIKSRELLHAFGRFIDRIGTVYATGEDVGMSVADIETVNEVTPFVGGTSVGAGDPSIHTAAGVIHGLRAVLDHKFSRNSFDGMRVAIQGLGAVGWGVAERLHQAGAKLVVADVRPGRVADAVAAFQAEAVHTDEIHLADVDIYSPCALGGVITLETAAQIKAQAVAGAANNQLASPEAGEALASRGILFAPDYVINAGGIISGAEALAALPGRQLAELAPLPDRLAKIHERLGRIFTMAATTGRTPEAAADAMARDILAQGKMAKAA